MKNTYVCEGINDKNNLMMSLNLCNVQLPRNYSLVLSRNARQQHLVA